MKRRNITQQTKKLNTKKSKNNERNLSNEIKITNNIINKSISDFFGMMQMSEKNENETYSHIKAESINNQIEREVKLERTRNQLLLINKCGNSDIAEKLLPNKVNNCNLKNIRPRDNFTNVVFPIILKSSLGFGNYFKNLAELKDFIKRKTILKFTPINILNLDQSFSRKCFDVVIDDELIGYLSKEVTDLLIKIKNLNSLKYYLILDTELIEIYVLLNFKNLAQYNSIEFLPNSNVFFKFKNTYLIPIDCVTVSLEFAMSSKAIDIWKTSDIYKCEFEEYLRDLSNLEVEKFNNLNKQQDHENYNLNIVNDSSSIDESVQELDNKSITNITEEFTDEGTDNNSLNYSKFLMNNIDNIFSAARNFKYLFNTNELKFINLFLSDLDDLDKEVIVKFFTRSSIWISKNNLIDNAIQESVLEKLLKIEFIKTSDNLFYIDNNEDLKCELTTFLYCLTNDEIKLIQKQIDSLSKFDYKLKDDEMICKEILLNNSFYGLDKYLDFKIFKTLTNYSSEYISQLNFDKRKTAIKSTLTKNTNNSNNKSNIKFITKYLNSSNFKKVKISKINFPPKMNSIMIVIKSIDKFINDKSSNIMNNFIAKKSTDFKNEKIEKIKKIFLQFNLFTLNNTLAKVFDCATRLFFFYSEFRDINDLVKSFYGFENFETFENYISNKEILNEEKEHLMPIFTSIYNYKLYDNLYQIKTSIQINEIIFNNNQLNYFIGKTFCFYLMKLVNPELFLKIIDVTKKVNLSIFNEFQFEKDTVLINQNEKICLKNPIDLSPVILPGQPDIGN